MLAFLRRLFRRQPLQRRDLFYYFDGSRIRTIDPLTVVQVLEYHEHFTWDKLASALQDDIPAQILVGATACQVFDVKPYEAETGEGLTMAQQITLMQEFDRYLYEVKKNIRLSPTSPPTTEPTSKPSKETTTSDS